MHVGAAAQARPIDKSHVTGLLPGCAAWNTVILIRHGRDASDTATIILQIRNCFRSFLLVMASILLGDVMSWNNKGQPSRIKRFRSSLEIRIAQPNKSDVKPLFFHFSEKIPHPAACGKNPVSGKIGGDDRQAAMVSRVCQRVKSTPWQNFNHPWRKVVAILQIAR